MHLTFQEAARGVNKNLTLNVVDTCAKCKGSKCEPNRTLVSCPFCNGTGMVRISFSASLRSFSVYAYFFIHFKRI